MASTPNVVPANRREVQLEQRMSAVEAFVPVDHGGHTLTIDTSSAADHTVGDATTDDQSALGSELDEAMLGLDTHNPLATPMSFDDQQTARADGNIREDALRRNCSLWFERYHSWFPILHRPSIFRSIAVGNDAIRSGRELVLQAVAVATADNTSSSHTIRLRETTILQALGSCTLDAVQALLILSIFEYGNGQLTRTWSLLAVCRRIGVNLGLRKLVDTYAGTSTTSPSALALQRCTSIAYTSTEHEESIRAYWMTEMLDSISSLGSQQELGFLSAPSNPLLPCSDTVWSQSEEAVGQYPLQPSHYSSAFSLCVMLALSELQMVHQFLRKPVNMAMFEERDTWQSEAQRIDERLTVWRDDFVAAVYRLINAEKTNDQRPEMDPFFVLTNCVLNSAVISLLQRRAPCPPGIDVPTESWAFASNRCIYACENTAFKVRQMTEDDMLYCNPHLLFSIFVAARFYIVHSKALDADVPVNLHSLAFALHVCGRCWPLAKSYEKIIRVAVADYRTPIAESTVPREFYDLALPTIEIEGKLKRWAEGFT